LRQAPFSVAEIVHRKSEDADAEAISINLQAVPSFDFNRLISINLQAVAARRCFRPVGNAHEFNPVA
jgi:hypothetical protein